ncbi:F-box family protein [Parasponia andersonii]|uniref:F-box family protein n=1 Tax=Parasponia andersonii TaxID=3476 RepID=A0A2P5CH62_PARAD|nr:F-box family protein [Parasponia andersonii]
MGFVYNMCLKKENSSSMACKSIRKEGMKYRFPERKYYFYNPLTKKVYSVKNEVKHACTSYPYKSCHAVRLGWFLLQFWCCGDLILYNAFTCEVINLPKVIPSEKFKFMTFYYCPKRRHFEVYGVHKAGKDDHQSAEVMKISICMWSSTSASGNNKGWETHTFKLEEDITDFDVKFFKAECVKGTELYCVFTNGTVGVSNACNKKWRVVVKSRWEILDSTYPDLVESEEELFLVHQAPYEWPIFKLDLSKKTWVEEADNLGDRALFSSRHSLCSSQFMILNPKLMKENLEGYVYYDYIGSNSVYSVSFKRLNLAKGSGDSDKWELKWPRQVLRGCPRHCWIHLCAIWIQPPPI